MTDKSSWNMQFTAGAQRALETAGVCSARIDADAITPESVLLGLLGQSECRAAGILRRFGVTPETVCRRWPLLQPGDEAGRGECQPRAERYRPFSAEMQSSLALAVDWLAGHSQPPELASEHLLWAIAAGGHEASGWLAERGLTAQVVEEDLCRVHGFSPPSRAGVVAPPDGEPIDVEADEGDEGETAEDAVVVQTGGRDQCGVLRVIDAAANRAREGLRVVEDFVRFVLDDAHLTRRLKQLRHDLAAAIAPIATQLRLAARETRADVGTEIATDDEVQRDRLETVLSANFSRLQESLRTLEEFLKLIDPELAAGVERLRYESYTLQRAVEISRDSGERLARARLCVLVDGRATFEAFQALADELVLAGVDVVQLRDKRLDDRAIVSRGRYLRQITRDTSTLFVINDRADLAMVTGADAVHLGQEDLSVKDARALVGPRMLIGVSVHSIEQARSAVLDGANYLGVGPTFPSRTKTFDHYPGPELIRAVSGEISLPAFAIGGIDGGNLRQVLAAGARRVAVGSAVADAENPGGAAAAMKAMFTT